MLSHTRKRPNKFTFTVDDSGHPGVWGIRLPFNRWGSRILKAPWPVIECEIKGNTVNLKIKGSKEVLVNLGKSGLRMEGKTVLVVNGKKVFEGDPDGEEKRFAL